MTSDLHSAVTVKLAAPTLFVRDDDAEDEPTGRFERARLPSSPVRPLLTAVALLVVALAACVVTVRALEVWL